MPLYDDNASDGLQEIKELLKELVESNKRIITLLEAASVFSAQPIPAFTYDPIQPAPAYWPPSILSTPVNPNVNPFGTPYCGDDLGFTRTCQTGQNVSIAQGGQINGGS